MGPDESFWILLKSLAENGLTLGDDLIGPAVVERFRGKETDASVMVLGVVPREESLAKGAGVLDRAKAIGELRPVLQGFELAFRERVVIGDVWAAMSFGDAEVGQ